MTTNTKTTTTVGGLFLLVDLDDDAQLRAAGLALGMQVDWFEGPSDDWFGVVTIEDANLIESSRIYTDERTALDELRDYVADDLR